MPELDGWIRYPCVPNSTLPEALSTTVTAYAMFGGDVRVVSARLMLKAPPRTDVVTG